MSTNQQHGITFEKTVLATCFKLSQEQVDSVGRLAAFDIPRGIITCAHPEGNPVSIKTAAVTAAKTSIGLADARRVWGWEGPFIVVVGLYNQEGSAKHFHSVFEFHFGLDESERKALYGDVTLDEVRDFHERIKLFPLGQHAAAQAWAKSRKKELASRIGFIQLNAKIDSKRQRRLQCSAYVGDFEVACKNTKRFTATDTGDYRGLPLPFVVLSGRRKRLTKQERQSSEAKEGHLASSTHGIPLSELVP